MNIYVKTYVIIIAISLLAVCCKNSVNYDVKVRFVDSAFVNDKQTYSSDEIIYILATESFKAAMPDTVMVTIESSLGDFEIVKCWNRGFIAIPEICLHGGSILSQYSSSYIHNNDILEANATNDVIQLLYEVKNQTAVDTAYVIAP